MFGQECEGCRLKDEVIALLKDQVTEAHKTALSVIDAKAYVLRFPAGKPRRESEPMEMPPLTPGEFRRQPERNDRPLMTNEEIEKSFAAEAELRNRGDFP